DLQVPAAAMIELAVAAANDPLRTDRHEYLRALADADAEEPIVRGADDLERVPVERDRLADDGRVAGIPALPKSVAQHGDSGTPPVVVSPRDQSPPDRPDA